MTGGIHAISAICGLSVRDIEDAFKDEKGPSCCPGRRFAAWGASVGGLPGVRSAGLERVGVHLSVCRRHSRAVAAGRQARAGSGGLGLHSRGPSGLAAPDGWIERRCGDSDGVLRGYEGARLNDPLLVTSDGAAVGALQSGVPFQCRLTKSVRGCLGALFARRNSFIPPGG